MFVMFDKRRQLTPEREVWREGESLKRQTAPRGIVEQNKYALSVLQLVNLKIVLVAATDHLVWIKSLIWTEKIPGLAKVRRVCCNNAPKHGVLSFCLL